ncbi:MAG: O-antigen ligase family protein [Actinomycetota bacterium]
MTMIETVRPQTAPQGWLEIVRSRLGLGVAATATALALAVLLDGGMWHIALALLMLPPAFVVVHRAPLAAVLGWLFIVPLLLNLDGLRPIFWLVHRLMPLALLGLFVVTRLVGIRSQRLVRLGAPEAMMAGYVAVTIVSVLYQSDASNAALIDVYDRIIAPMALYLVVRLTQPDERVFRWLGPLAGFIVVTQTIFGLLSWTAPGLLPSDWLTRVNTRTTGSLISPSVYGVTMLAAGMILLHIAANERVRWRRLAGQALFGLAFLMAILSLTRGVWLAAVAALAMLSFAHPASVRRVLQVALPVIAILIVSGAANAQLERLETRFESDSTALSRLPVVYASLEMFQERPVLGWGFGNFDEIDRQFQRSVAGFFPEKDQASHNLYLTVLAEQGLVGLTLFIGPALWWLVRSRRAYRYLPRSGLVSRTLLITLWAILLAHLAVNNLSNMRSVFGLGSWWLTLGMIGVVVSSVNDSRAADELPLLSDGPRR